ARILREDRIPFVIVDIQGERVQRGRAVGDPVYFGDISRAEVLRHFKIKEAKILVLAVSDPFALRRAIHTARQINPSVHIVTRARYVRDLDELFGLGASEIVPEEFESSLEILAMVLGRYGVSPGRIAKKQEEIRREGYAALSQAAAEPYVAKGILPAEVEVIRHRLQEDSPVIGKKLAELELPARTGAIVVAVIRGEETLSSPGGSFALQSQDILVLVGVQEELKRAILYLNEGDKSGKENSETPPFSEGGVVS
ncbi:MAG TPA: NAD-binding protein, partial [Candidatus Manganitrophaceae bacterium]